MRKVIISRDSVCMGDDVMAPHYMTIEIGDDMSYSDLLKKLIAIRYLPNSGVWLLTCEEGNLDIAIYYSFSGKIKSLIENHTINVNCQRFYLKYFGTNYSYNRKNFKEKFGIQDNEWNNELYRIINLCKEITIYFNSTTKLLSIEEILNKNFNGVVAENIVPIMEIYQNVFIAYDVHTGKFIKLDVCEGTIIEYVESIEEYIYIVEQYFRELKGK